MKYRIFSLLVCMICLAAAIPPVAADNYMGGDVVLGGAGPNTIKITEITTAVTPATTAPIQQAVQPDTGSLSITSTPPGATVFIDGVQRGVSPATIPGLSPGSHRLLLKLDGYQDFSVPVSIMGGRTSTYTTSLLPASTTQPPLPATKKTPGFGVFSGIAALGAIGAVKKISR